VAEKILKVELPAESRHATEKYAIACDVAIRAALRQDSKSTKFLDPGEKVWARLPLTDRKVLEHLTSSPCAYEFRVGAGYVDFRWRYETHDSSPDRNVVQDGGSAEKFWLRCRYCGYTIDSAQGNDTLVGAMMKSHLVEHRMERLERTLSKLKKLIKGRE